MEYDFPYSYIISSFLLVSAIFLLLYWQSKRKLEYWKERGIPHPKPMPFLGNIWDLFTEPPNEIEMIRYKKYGVIYGHFEGNRPLLSVGDPKLLRDILVKDFHAFTGRRDFKANDEVADKMMSVVQGEDWKRIRAIVSPTFTTGKLKRMLGIFKDCAKGVVKNFQVYAEKGEPVNVKSIYGAFTMDVIASAAFSTKIDSHNDPNNKFVSAARNIFRFSLNWRILMNLFFPGLAQFLKIRIFFPKELDFFSSVIHQIIEQRKKGGQAKNDFLQLLLDTAEEVEKEGKINVDEKEEDITENYGQVDSNQVLKNAYTKKTLTTNELVAQCVIFFIAGYDTTASTLSFATYLMALNPEVQEKLRTEVDEVLEENNEEVTYEAIQSMKYLDNVIAETLRVYSPAVRLERLAEEDYKLGDTGITIPKKMIISIPVSGMHKDPKYYPDPEKFDPDRFKPEERAKRDPYVYLPFGVGPRNCIGMRFALLEIKVCLAMVVRNFIFKRCPETKVPLEFHKGQFVIQPKEITIQLESRRDWRKSL